MTVEAQAPDLRFASEPPAVLFDVSRLISRLGTGQATGIDRVEAEWLRALQHRRHLLLARVPKRQLLLPAEVGADLLAWLADPGLVPPARGLVARLRRATVPRARADEVLASRALATGTSTGRGLGRAIARHLPPGSAWLAVGHANLSPGPWRALPGLRKAVMIHDTIPLDFPQFSRVGQNAAFRRRLMASLGHADIILTVSEASRADVLRWRERLQTADRIPIEAISIGTTLAPSAPQDIPRDLPLDRPFFIALGTIEPRKNHALLLDAWALLAERLPEAKMPRLLILGRRGWENAATFARLDALATPGGPVIERAGIGDGAVAALLDRAHGLVMPSLAEGFGLPLPEAAGRGVPVLATPLPAAREVLAGYPAHWLPSDDPAPWAETIAAMARGPAQRHPPLAPGSWSAHVTRVLELLGTV